MHSHTPHPLTHTPTHTPMHTHTHTHINIYIYVCYYCYIINHPIVQNSNSWRISHSLNDVVIIRSVEDTRQLQRY